jgi:hypothetical protein
LLLDEIKTVPDPVFIGIGLVAKACWIGRVALDFLKDGSTAESGYNSRFDTCPLRLFGD